MKAGAMDFLEKPFDEGLIDDMAETARFLCGEIQGAKCAYVQSDEISILLTDFDKLNTDAWFDYQVQKRTSVAASMASAKFNQLRLARHFAEIGELEEGLWKFAPKTSVENIKLRLRIFKFYPMIRLLN